MEITIRVITTGEHSVEELIDFVRMELCTGSCSIDNPFTSEDGDAEIISIEED